jgi:hypothetical protein
MVLSLFFFVIQCSTNNILQNEYVGIDGIILSNKNNTGSFKLDRYRLNDIKIMGDSIVINVSYSGGCRDHEFNLIAKNYFGDTNLPKTELVLSHNSNMDPCEAYPTEEYIFVLSPLKYEFYRMFGKKTGSIRLILDEREIVYSF